MLGIMPGDVVSIIGCGGKTSLLHGLAAANTHMPVLIGTTTRMQMPLPDAYDRRWQPGMPAAPGTTLAAEDAEGGKIRGISPEAWAALAPHYGLTLLEADGSKMRPLKGWAAHEPVILPETTLTVGVCTLWPVGLTISDDLVHRLPLFTAITGAQAGMPCTPAHIASMVAHPQGMFARAQGRRALWINQADSIEAQRQADAFYRLLPEAFRRTLSGAACGSLRHGVRKTLGEAYL